MAVRGRPLPSKKKPSPKRKPSPKKKRRAAPPSLSPQQRSAIVRAVRALASLGQPRSWWRRATKELFARRRQQLAAILERAGFTDHSIRARLGWITRGRNVVRKKVAEERSVALGTELLDKKDPRTGLYVEEDRNRILRNMIRARDRRYMQFLRAVQEEFNLTESEVENEWFSPKLTG